MHYLAAGLAAIGLGYIVVWMVFLAHFNAGFNRCVKLWSEAHARGDYAAARVYMDAEMLAHEDTSMAMVWPLVMHRWDTNYVAEARKVAH